MGRGTEWAGSGMEGSRGSGSQEVARQHSQSTTVRANSTRLIGLSSASSS